MMRLGLSADRYAKLYRADDKRITDYSANTVGQYLGAIKRAVKKYGSVENAKKAYLVETRRMYIEIAYFIAWSPDGQRAKNQPKQDSKQKLYATVSLNRSEANKRLASLPKSMRDEIITLLGIK